MKRKRYQPMGSEGFAKACPHCMNQGSSLCARCKMEVESGYEPAVCVTTDTGKHTVYGGQRGGGKIFHLETLVAFLTEEVKELKEDRDRWKSAALFYREKAMCKSEE